MKLDIKGHVSHLNLPVTKPLLPVFEAIINSFDAIDQRRPMAPKIVIRTQRESASSNFANDTKIASIIGFIIEDNGAGFTEENYLSFDTASSRFKLNGKGTGRFLWLKAFSDISIESIYEEGGEWRRRSFRFDESADDGIVDPKIEVLGTGVDHQPLTRVSLLGYKEIYKSKCPKGKDSIAHSIIEHCVTRFIDKGCPNIVFSDEDGEMLLNDVFRSEYWGNAKTDTVAIRDCSIEITTLRLTSREAKRHELHLCANDRSVETSKLNEVVPILDGKLTDGDVNSFYAYAFVTGVCLDKAVNRERTQLDLPDSIEIGLPGIISRGDIHAAVRRKVSEHLSDVLAPLIIERQRRIESYVDNQAPSYRPLFKHRAEAINGICGKLTDEKIELELHKIQRDFESDTMQKLSISLAKLKSENVEHDEYEKLYGAILGSVTDIGQAELTKYIAHRKTIIELFDASLGLARDGKYAREDVIHRIIYPMKATSEDVLHEHQNLWIIDERLSYHRMLTSDRPINETVNGTTSTDRPDLVVFNQQHVFTEQAEDNTNETLSSVVIIEFKRPMREDYKKEHPFSQVVRYCKQLRSGNLKNQRGRVIKVNDSTRVFAYIICDLLPEVAEPAITEYSFRRMVDGDGLFKQHEDPAMYIEMLSFDRVLRDAKRRNQILFERLGIRSYRAEGVLAVAGQTSASLG
jgi:hypothetical protein